MPRIAQAPAATKNRMIRTFAIVTKFPAPIIVTLKPDISRLSRTSSVPGQYPGRVALIRSFGKRESFWCQDTPKRYG
jgi:hypothetical protein